MKRNEILILAKSLKAELVETHISWVLLTKKLAYKIKKPLKTNFLDFSSLAKRKKICFKELELNKVLSPDIYLGVVGIKKSEDKYIIDSVGKPVVDYAVKMKRMDSARQLDVMLSKNKVTMVHIRSIAKAIASFHLRTKVIKKEKPVTQMIYDFNDLLSVKKEIAQLLGTDMFKQTLEAVEKAIIFLDKSASVFLERVKGGFIKECHGDLHSGNIFVYKNPVLFDRIEFKEDFRHIDVLHELGFLCMDLEANGKKRLSKELLQYYVQFSGIEFGEKEKSIVNYYKCYTANVRAKVNLLRANQDELHKKKYIAVANKYLKLVFDYVHHLRTV